MNRRDDDKKREEGKVEESSNPNFNFNSKVRCKGNLILLAPLKRGGPGETATSTPVLPWKLQPGGGEREIAVVESGIRQRLLILPLSPAPIPPRRLAAAVWEFVQYFSPIEAMEFGEDENHQQRRRRDHLSHYLHHRHHLEKGIGGFHDQVNLGGPSHRSPEHHQQPPTAGSLRHQVAMLLAQPHRASARYRPPPQPPSPASYASSLEINPYNQASTPTSSVDLKGVRVGDPSNFGFKTSTELLKVLNRIWTLEEQNVSNIALVKDLKTELNHARVRIKELLRDKQSRRHEIDNLMEQVARSKEHERSIRATIDSLKHELDDERKLRKRSEGLHRRLAREISDVKVALASSIQQADRERASRCLLEDLCDEFAKGIIEHEREARVLGQKNEKNINRLVVRMSESWLDERFQMKDQEDAPQETAADKLRDEIENFLQARKMAGSIGNGDSVKMKKEISEIEPALDQDKGVTEVVDKPISELLVSEGKAAMSESGSKNSLKAKLQEPKARVGYRSRLRILKGSS